MRTLELSEEQRQAIENIEGATLLLAVPGSGKTTTLIARIGRMIYDFGIPPEKILVITYTRNAARDMRERFAEFYGPQYAGRIDFRTINSFCYSVVMKYAQVAGRTKPEDDTDLEGNVRRLFGSVYDEQFPDENEIRDLAQQITYIKNMGLADDEISGLNVDDRPVKPMYDAYKDYLKTNGKMDYDDQIVFAHMLFRNNVKGLRDYYSDRYPYVLVDEAQDTSKLQHEVIRMLVEKHGNLFLVGDEDQSIYGFRAAYPDALVKFTEIYKGGQVRYLQTNFRSAQSIVDTAAKVIVHNENRYKKNILAARSDEGRVSFYRLQKRADQYQYIIDKLDENTETAILYRNNDSALPFISYLQRAGIPYKCKGIDALFFSNKVIIDAMDILEFAFDPGSKALIWKLYYKFNLKVHKSVLYDATQRLRPSDRHPILNALYVHEETNRMQRKKLDSLIYQFDEIRRNNDAKDAIHRIRTEMGYNNASSEKLYILEAMAFPGEEIAHFRQRLRHLDYLIREGQNQTDTGLILSTIHGSKGLEYDKVILVDAVNDILPSVDNDIEEERRIFYVGVTRARDELVLMTYSDQRSLFMNEAAGIHRAEDYRYSKSDRKGRSKTKTPVKISSEKTTVKSPFKAGDIVKHKDYGTGRVVWIRDDYISIDFGGKGKKTFLLSLVLEKGYLK